MKAQMVDKLSQLFEPQQHREILGSANNRNGAVATNGLRKDVSNAYAISHLGQVQRLDG